MATFQATLSPMLMMFFCILVGYLLARGKVLPGDTETVLSKLESWVFLPALILNTFMEYCTPATIRAYGGLMATSVLLMAAAILIATVLSGAFVREGYQRGVYKYALAFGNFGFMGNAIVPAIVGEAALYPYLLFTLPLQVGAYTWGMGVLIPRDKQTGGRWKKLVNPVVISMLLGAVIGLGGLGRFMPGFAVTALKNLGGCMGPVAMLLTGVVVARYDFSALLKNRKVYVAAALRLLVLPGLYTAALVLLGVGETTILMALFAFATPLGLNTVVFPAAYGGDTSTGASMAMISHTLSVLTIPLMYAAVTAIL